ncbi:hypothetical protein [Acidipila rosea]|uniref:Uncharacterized protein n=1 Tax=Acidipila rosea TaxID=768535 RepID=A0A4R1LBW9_9BACT|nr:hypothetical protein [Acidipila rosea]TCK75872.1 hypothetical protein C7378_0871 [Acidipila rosea]
MNNYGCAGTRPNRDHSLPMPATGPLLVVSDQGLILHARLAVGATGKDSLPVQTASEPTHPATVKECLTVQSEISRQQRRQLETSQPVSDFDRTVEQIKQLGAPKPKSVRKGEMSQ